MVAAGEEVADVVEGVVSAVVATVVDDVLVEVDVPELEDEKSSNVALRHCSSVGSTSFWM